MKTKYIVIMIASIFMLGLSSCNKKAVNVDPLAGTRWLSNSVIDEDHPENNVYTLLTFYTNGEYSLTTLVGIQKSPKSVRETGKYKFVGNKEQFQTYVIFIPDNTVYPNTEEKGYYHEGTIHYNIFTFYPQ